MEYFKSMVPSQLIAERGSDIVIINPGSSNLRIGLASTQAPVVVPHLIAWHVINTMAKSEAQDYCSRAAVGETLFSSCSVSDSRKDEREEAFQLIEMELRIPIPSQEDVQSGETRKMDVAGDNAVLTPPGAKSCMWTQVQMEGGQISASFESSSPECAIDEDLLPGNGDNIPKKEGSDNCLLNSVSGKKGQYMQSVHKFICGDEVLRIPFGEPYYLRRPICRGRLNVSDQYSLQQVCDDMHTIWDWTLSVKLGLGAEDRRHFSAVLVVPDTLDSREIKELLTVVLRDLRFFSAVVHQESVAATFGNGVTSACVVNIGAQVTSVICVEDGVALPSTRVTLPFGGEDISRSLLWVQRRLNVWPPIDCDPLRNPLDLLMLNRLKETHCCIKEGDQRVFVELEFHAVGMPKRFHRASLWAMNMPPMGLFHPALLTPEEYIPLSRPWYHTDCEDILLDDAIHVETGRKSEVTETGASIANQGSALLPGSLETSLKILEDLQTRREEHTMGLSQAIVNSILSVGRVDLQRKLFSSIQLVGGVASTHGLIDAVEERVLHAIPAHEAIDTVEVLQHRSETGNVAWKGGAVLGILDFARDTWIQHEDWSEGGIRVGTGRKYKDSYFLQTHTFWYTSS